MLCPNCGRTAMNPTGACAHCGTPMMASALSGSTMGSQTAPAPMNFGDAIMLGLNKFKDFSGRASRAEFWWFYLFTVIAWWVSSRILPGLLSFPLNLALTFALAAVGTRRLHDVNKSGWWQLLALTVIGLIPLMIWWASEGSEQTNKHGPAV